MHPTFEAKLEEIRANSHVSPFLHFQDENLSREYQKFKVSQSNTYAYIPLHLAACFFHLTGSYRGMKISFDFINVFNFVMCFIFTMFIGTWLIVVHNKALICRKDSKMWAYLDATYTAWLESVWIIGGAVCLSLVPVTLAANGLCGEGQSRVASGCNYSGDVHEVPMDITMALFFAPIIHAVVLQGASFFYVVVAIGINTSVLFTVMFLYSMTFRGPIIMLFCPLCLLVMYEFQRQGISMFLLSKKQEIMMDEIERLNSQSAKELRSMIGNVAHDLKTPISAFVSGLDYVYTILMEIQEDLIDNDKVRKGLLTITESVVNMKNINSFMKMSINRCIDYTKASNGMVLVPHMETINFRDCLQLPLHCMKNLQDGRVPIELLQVSNDISNYVILDPQWFQENVLCLLSNAVKYSAEGVVTISATLVNERPTTPAPSPNAATAPTGPGPGFGFDLTNVVSGLMPASAPDTRGTEPFIRIEVEDNGIGISDELKAHLFNPFKQAQRFAGGTGLGLYSLAKRMEAMGGGYGVKNKTNGKQGSVFWFTVPYRPDLSTECTLNLSLFGNGLTSSLSPIVPLVQGGAGIAAATSAKRAGSPALGAPGAASEGGAESGKVGLHILLVDDAISIQKMTGKMLTRMGHTVSTAENGAVALKMMSAVLKPTGAALSLSPQPAFDVVLMDLQMPVMDGLESTKRLRALESEHSANNDGAVVHQLIVGVSANSDHEAKAAAFDAGVDEFIPKPFNIKEFDALYLRLSKKMM